MLHHQKSSPWGKTIFFFPCSSGTLKTGMLRECPLRGVCLLQGSQSLTWGPLDRWCTSSISSNGFCSHTFWKLTVIDAWQTFSEFCNDSYSASCSACAVIYWCLRLYSSRTAGYRILQSRLFAQVNKAIEITICIWPNSPQNILL